MSPAKRDKVELTWEGAATVQAASAAMARGDAVEIVLPQGVHHALYRHLHPRAGAGLPEDLEQTGGPALLRRISGVAGLEEAAALEEPARRARYRVRIATPDPTLSLLPPGASAAEKKSGSTALAGTRGWRPK